MTEFLLAAGFIVLMVALCWTLNRVDHRARHEARLRLYEYEDMARDGYGPLTWSPRAREARDRADAEYERLQAEFAAAETFDQKMDVVKRWQREGR